MLDRLRSESRLVLTVGLVAMLGLFTLSCGGGGGDSGDALEDLWVERFSVPNFSGILLDEAVSWVFSEIVQPGSLNPQSVQLRTGTTGGEPAIGTFLAGTFLFDPITASRVVVDPDQLPAADIAAAEASGTIPAFFAPFRYDLGAKSAANGNRQVLYNRANARQVTFIPAIPTRPDLSDTGYAPGADYSVILPAFPSLTTVRTPLDDPLLPREGRVFTSTFTTVPGTAPQLFLGGENQGRPRVINTDPENGGLSVIVSIRIRIRFSHPLDPRTVTPENFLLTVPSQPGSPSAVSLFLRQSRLGICEVVLTPLSDLTGDTVYQVNLKSGVRDLLGNTLEPFTFSFSTGAGFVPSDIIEPFLTEAKRLPNTTANWDTAFDRNNDSSPDGALIAEFAPWAGNGSNGEFVPPIGETTLLQTVDTLTGAFIEYQYESIFIDGGATVLGQGERGLVMRSQGDVEIVGDIDVAGLDGGTGQTGNSSNLVPTGGAGGAAGPGGYDGGDGAMTTLDATNFHGLDGKGPGASNGGRGGHSGDQESTVTEDQPREGGGGGGHSTGGATHNANLFAQKPSMNPNDGGLGGTTYSAINPPFLPVENPLVNKPANWGGAGGGGGGGEDDSVADLNGDGIANGPDEGGGGGGGGGGGLLIVSYTTVKVVGRIVADGGRGGNTFNAGNGTLGQGAPGGGGAGGSVWIQCLDDDMEIVGGAEILAEGGEGGQGGGLGNTIYIGGLGADGYIFLQDGDGGPDTVPSTVQPSASTSAFTPDTVLDSVGFIGWFDQFILTPNYGAAVIDQELNNGTIEILVQGSREDLLNPGNPVDPDVDVDRLFTTDWLPIASIDSVDNFRFLRMQILFSVNPLQAFGDPLPIVHQITIPVSTVPD